MAANNSLRTQNLTWATATTTNDLTCADGCAVVGLEFDAVLAAGTFNAQKKLPDGSYRTLYKTDGTAYAITVAANAQAVEIPANDLKSLTVFRFLSSVNQTAAGRVLTKPL